MIHECFNSIPIYPFHGEFNQALYIQPRWTTWGIWYLSIALSESSGIFDGFMMILYCFIMVCQKYMFSLWFMMCFLMPIWEWCMMVITFIIEIVIVLIVLYPMTWIKIPRSHRFKCLSVNIASNWLLDCLELRSWNVALHESKWVAPSAPSIPKPTGCLIAGFQ